MHQKAKMEDGTLKYIKLKNGEDIVGVVTVETSNTVSIKRPLAFVIENDFEYNRQLLNIREWMPPIVAKDDVISIKKSTVFFITDVKDTFIEEYNEAVKTLYGITPRKRQVKTEENSNVVTLLPQDHNKKH
jgi:hypothetical protein